MDEMSMLKKSNEILQQQNSDLAESLQHWKSEYGRLEIEKVNLLRENIKCKQQIAKFKNIENSVRLNLTRSLTGIIKSTNHIQQIIETLDEQDVDLWSKKTSPLPVRTPLQSNASNVNHVHPMIQGVTIKKPVIRISRASLNTIVRTTAQVLAEDNSNDVIQAMVEDNPSNVMDSVVDVEETSQSQQVTDSPRQLLDLCVSLSRVDAIDRVTSRKNINMDSSTEHNVSQQGLATDDMGSQGSESSSQNSGYSEENEGSANIISGEPFDYKSRLDCIFEESETEAMNWVNSRRKMNPFVVLNDTIESDLNTTPVIIKTPNKQLGRILSDDPMEGTSWRLDAQIVNSKLKPNITPKKDATSNNIIENENSMEGSQVPDSTTCGMSSRDSNQEQDQSFVKTFPSVLEFQSTPVASTEPDQNKNETPPRSKSPMSPSRHPIEAKVVLSKLGADASHAISENKTEGKLKRCSKTSSRSDITAKKKSRRNKSEARAPEDSSLLFQTSTETSHVETSRPRRGEVKNYKEKPLNNKLRRSK